MMGPRGGRGIGGRGGGPLGGCLTCAWGIPSAMLVRVAAGNGPMAAARPLTSSDIFSSAAAPPALARKAPGSATLLAIDAADDAAELKAWMFASALFRPSAMECLRSGGGAGSLGCAG